jgi:hypothetical protein
MVDLNIFEVQFRFSNYFFQRDNFQSLKARVGF